jgi:hypothetical protein
LPNGPQRRLGGTRRRRAATRKVILVAVENRRTATDPAIREPRAVGLALDEPPDEAGAFRKWLFQEQDVSKDFVCRE